MERSTKQSHILYSSSSQTWDRLKWCIWCEILSNRSSPLLINKWTTPGRHELLCYLLICWTMVIDSSIHFCLMSYYWNKMCHINSQVIFAKKFPNWSYLTEKDSNSVFLLVARKWHTYFRSCLKWVAVNLTIFCTVSYVRFLILPSVVILYRLEPQKKSPSFRYPSWQCLKTNLFLRFITIKSRLWKKNSKINYATPPSSNYKSLLLPLSSDDNL